MKTINKQDFVGKSEKTLDDAIEQAIGQGVAQTKQYQVIEMTGCQQTNNEKHYQVVLSERND